MPRSVNNNSKVRRNPTEVLDGCGVCGVCGVNQFASGEKFFPGP